MPRRRNTPDMEIPNVPRASVPRPERPSVPAALPPQPVPAPVPPPKGTAFANQSELDITMAAYRANPGICPICRAKIGRGASGHISKCLRLMKFKLESTPTT